MKEEVWEDIANHFFYCSCFLILNSKNPKEKKIALKSGLQTYIFKVLIESNIMHVETVKQKGRRIFKCGNYFSSSVITLNKQVKAELTVV